MSTTTQRLGLFKYDTVADSQVPFNIDDALNYNWDILDQKVGPNRNVGEIVYSSLPLTDAGLHLLDGTLIPGDGIYSGFVDYIADLYVENPTANYWTTETDWQQFVTDYGVCGKFVYDSINNTVRLPLYSNKIYTQEFEATAPVKGNGMALGLTNGTNNVGLAGSGGTAYVNASAYGANVTNASVSGSSGTGYFGVTTDSSKSGIIADFSNITTSLDGYYYIVIANSTKTEIEVDIDEIATDLNMKVDKSTLVEAHVVIETYTNGASWYRIYNDGWCEQGGTCTSGTAVTYIKAYVDDSHTNTCPHSAKSATGFTPSQTGNWLAAGYIA